MDGSIKRRYDIEGAIFEGWERTRGNESSHRPFLGASDIGNECPRNVWYTYRHVMERKFSGRLYRLFDRGHREEDVFANDLNSAGIEIVTHKEDGDQIEYKGYGGHVVVHLDGIARVPKRIDLHNLNVYAPDEVENLVVEMKTMALKKHKSLCEKGVKEACKDYYRQMQTQLLIANRQTKNTYTGALFIAVNKNTDDIYVEKVDIDKEEQKKVHEIIMGILQDKVPDRLNVSENSIPCRWCDYKPICREGGYEKVEQNCRSCHHSKMVDESKNDGERWVCGIGNVFGVPCKDWSQHIGI